MKFYLLSSGILLIATVASAAVKTLNPADFVLNGYSGTQYSSVIKTLDQKLPIVNVTGVLASNNHPTKAYAGPSNFIADFTWDKKTGYDDQNTEKWYPQGITTSSDAYDAGTYEGKSVILVSWYDNEDDGISKGVRVSFVDASAKTYRNVLLVVPTTTTDGTATFSPVNVHAGGIMWYGTLLYVVDTNHGLRIFDLSHIYEVDIGDNLGYVSSTGTYQAYGYKYVIPQSGRYDAYSDTAKDFNFSFISLDRTTKPDSILMGQYDVTGAKNRIVRFDIDYTTRLLQHTSSSSTQATATAFYNLGLTSMQGAASYQSSDGTMKYYFSCSRGGSTKGDLYTWVPGNAPVAHKAVLSIGCEDLSYRRQDDQLWSLGEHPGKRPVYAIKRQDY